MKKFTGFNNTRAAILAAALSCAASLALGSGASGTRHAQTSPTEDVASAKLHRMSPSDDRNTATDREMLEEKLILHGHLPLRARAHDYQCGYRGDDHLTKQNQTMNALSDSDVAPATTLVRNKIDAQFVKSRGL